MKIQRSINETIVAPSMEEVVAHLLKRCKQIPADKISSITLYPADDPTGITPSSYVELRIDYTEDVSEPFVTSNLKVI